MAPNSNLNCYITSLTVRGYCFRLVSYDCIYIMMTQSRLHRPIGKGIIFGAIGGFVGGLVMYAVMSGVMEAIGMGANCFAVILALITGQPFSNSLVPIGLAIHLVTSTENKWICKRYQLWRCCRIDSFCYIVLTYSYDCNATKNDRVGENDVNGCNWFITNDIKQ